jgi:hypothetical protein
MWNNLRQRNARVLNSLKNDFKQDTSDNAEPTLSSIVSGIVEFTTISIKRLVGIPFQVGICELSEIPSPFEVWEMPTSNGESVKYILPFPPSTRKTPQVQQIGQETEEQPVNSRTASPRILKGKFSLPFFPLQKKPQSAAPIAQEGQELTSRIDKPPEALTQTSGPEKRRRIWPLTVQKMWVVDLGPLTLGGSELNFQEEFAVVPQCTPRQRQVWQCITEEDFAGSLSSVFTKEKTSKV